MNHDIGGVPSVCPSCDIPIYPGTSHGSLQGCYVALKAFVKLCQDDIENSRMQSFQHPTRQELLDNFNYLESEFEKFVIYVNAIRERMRNAQRGTIVG